MTSPEAAWESLGRQLFERRTQISPRYANRSRFATERGIDYRLVYDVERARRQNFGESAVAAIESAYQLAPGAIRAYLDGGGGELKTADHAEPSGAPLSAVPEDEPAVTHPDKEKWNRVLDETARDVADLWAQIGAARAKNPAATPDEIFPDDPTMARMFADTENTEPKRVLLMAVIRMAMRQDDDGERRAI